MKKIVFILFIMALVSFIGKEESRFSLKGKTNNLENGTVLYLKDNLTEKIIDSAIITDNQFSFAIKTAKFPLRVLLYNKSFSQWRDIWLENNQMFFDASKGDFKNAKVTGSESENLSQKLYENIGRLSFEEKNALEKKFVKDHPNSIVSAFILSVFVADWGKDYSKECYDRFSEDIKKSEYGKRISNYITLNRDVKIGDQYSNFVMKDKNGNPKEFSQLIGKVTLLEFWASWCGPCREENPNLVKTYKKYRSNGFAIVAISLDKDEKKWLAAIEKDGLLWDNFCDFGVWESTPALMYGVYAVPENFLIDKNGKIVARNIRGEELNKKLTELVND
ncbi:TlpA disulfide reductase family protein [Flavobacterium sp. 245]|uniref:TlpA disulfide reductase family protein n=1 Tax=Flavobacterium sp. 245 TaxID=2512115 RepID=UPI00105CE759|nr:TlpA disulfide reductase family protein [Flavobacterium sp. 245]TDO99206.1 thiol-disulfide isomerase/thioredoxin [Flavobacterium sp. 245]